MGLRCAAVVQYCGRGGCMTWWRTLRAGVLVGAGTALLAGLAPAAAAPGSVVSGLNAGYVATTTVTSLTAGVTVPTLSCAGVGAAGPVSVAVQVAESGPAGRGALFELDFTCDAGTASYGGYFGSPNGVHFSLGFVPAAGDKIMVKMWAGQVAGWTWVKATDELFRTTPEIEVSGT